MLILTRKLCPHNLVNMSAEKYKSTMHTHSDHLREMLHEMMKTNEFSDVTLVCDDKKQIKAHRNILSASSPVFKNILQIDTQSNHPVIYLRGIKYQDMESILQFIYLGKVTFYQERMNEFLFVANNLEIKELTKNVEEVSEPVTSDRTEGLGLFAQPKVSGQSPKVNSPVKNCKNPVNNVNIEEKMETEAIDKVDLTLAEDFEETQEEEGEVVKFACNQCQYQTAEEEDMTDHIKTVHESIPARESKYPCNQCGKQFTFESNLRTHIQSTHEAVKYSCTKCPYETTKQEKLTNHVQSVHEDEGIKYCCTSCNAEFNSQIELTRHTQTMHKEVKYSCNQCDQTFSLHNSLKAHIQNVHVAVKMIAANHPNQSKVKQSNQAQSASSTKQNSMVKTVKSIYKYSCKLCNSAFTLQSSLNRHTKNIHKTINDL